MENIVYSFTLTLALVGCIDMQAKEVTLSTNQRLLAATKGLGFGSLVLANGAVAAILLPKFLENISHYIRIHSTPQNKLPFLHREVLHHSLNLTAFSAGLLWSGFAAGKRSFESFIEAYVGKTTVQDEIEITFHQTKVE